MAARPLTCRFRFGINLSMKTLPIFLPMFLLSIGCMPLTSTAKDCGTMDGLEVYVDNGGMNFSCSQATDTVQAAQGLGFEGGFWDHFQTWDGFRVEFIDSYNLKSLGHPGDIGHQNVADSSIAVSDGYGVSSARGILMHELIHATYGEPDHCNWASRYEEVLFRSGDNGMFADLCQHMICNAGTCKHCDKIDTSNDTCLDK